MSGNEYLQRGRFGVLAWLRLNVQHAGYILISGG